MYNKSFKIKHTNRMYGNGNSSKQGQSIKSNTATFQNTEQQKQWTCERISQNNGPVKGDLITRRTDVDATLYNEKKKKDTGAINFFVRFYNTNHGGSNLYERS